MSGFLTITEASAFLKVTTRTMYDICSSGKLTFYQGKGRTGKLRFTEEDLMAYMKEFRVDRNPDQVGTTTKIETL